MTEHFDRVKAAVFDLGIFTKVCILFVSKKYTCINKSGFLKGPLHAGTYKAGVD